MIVRYERQSGNLDKINLRDRAKGTSGIKYPGGSRLCQFSSTAGSGCSLNGFGHFMRSSLHLRHRGLRSICERPCSASWMSRVLPPTTYSTTESRTPYFAHVDSFGGRNRGTMALGIPTSGSFGGSPDCKRKKLVHDEGIRGCMPWLMGQRGQAPVLASPQCTASELELDRIQLRLIMLPMAKFPSTLHLQRMLSHRVNTTMQHRDILSASPGLLRVDLNAKHC